MQIIASAVTKFVSTMNALSYAYYISAALVGNHCDYVLSKLISSGESREYCHSFNDKTMLPIWELSDHYDNLKIPTAIDELNKTMSTRGYKRK